MRVWFVSTFITENMWFNDADPGDDCNEEGCDKEYCTVCYQYETDYEGMFCSPLYATEEAAIVERNKMFIDAYENERKAHADRLKRYNKRKEAVELLALTGFNPEDLYPYGIGDEPKFSYPKVPRIGYLEVVEN